MLYLSVMFGFHYLHPAVTTLTDDYLVYTSCLCDQNTDSKIIQHRVRFATAYSLL